MAFIVSKASQDIEYVDWTDGVNGVKRAKKSVIIKGGANVVDKKLLSVSNGTVTEVSNEDLEFLKSNTAFQRHLERGWMSIEKGKETAEKVAKKKRTNKDGETIKDGSAQLTAEDFERNGQKPPLVGGAE